MKVADSSRSPGFALISGDPAIAVTIQGREMQWMSLILTARTGRLSLVDQINHIVSCLTAGGDFAIRRTASLDSKWLSVVSTQPITS